MNGGVLDVGEKVLNQIKIECVFVSFTSLILGKNTNLSNLSLENLNL